MSKKLLPPGRASMTGKTLSSVDENTPISEVKPEAFVRPGLSSSRVLKRQDAFVYTSDILWNESLRKYPTGTLTPKLGKVKINDEIEKMRILLNQHNVMNPHYIIPETLSKTKLFIEFCYNLLGPLLLPIILFKEGWNGASARDYVGCPNSLFSYVTFILLFTADIVYFGFADQELKGMLWFNISVMNHLMVVRAIIIGIKYGYYSPTVFEEYRKDNPKITKEYIQSIHLMPGWGKQNPLTMAREFWISQKRLRLDLSKLRLIFRDTSQFDVDSMKNCKCSKWETTLDWLVPYVYTYTNIGAEFVSDRLLMILGFVTFISVSWSNIYRFGRFWNANERDNEYYKWDTCGWECIVLQTTIPWILALNLWIATNWSCTMATDFNRRYSRSKFLTHLLDPKRKAFSGVMRETYKAHLFGSKRKIPSKYLKKLDLHTIDVFNHVSIYSWCQLRNIFYDCGKEFLNREEAYVGVLILYAMLMLLFLIYGMLEDGINIIFEDFVCTVIFVIVILGPAFWSLSCAKAMNHETLKQKRFFYERMAEMQNYEFEGITKINQYTNNINNNKNMETKLKRYQEWLLSVKKAREMAECAVDVLDESSYSIRFIGIKADESVQTLLITLTGILIYLVLFAAVQPENKGFLPKWIYKYPNA